MIRKGFLICFIGIDGSGKTTLAKKVNEELKKDGIDSQYLYGRVIPIFSRFLMWIGRKFLLKKRKESIFQEYHEYSAEKRKLLRKNIFSKVYMYSFLFDQIIQANIKIKPYLLTKEMIICDRYIFDTVITDISANLGYSNNKTNNLINKLFYLVPKPDIVFLVDVPEEIAYNRKKDIPHIDYLRERRKLYMDVKKSFEIIILDGTKKLDELVKEAYATIKSYLRM